MIIEEEELPEGLFTGVEKILQMARSLETVQIPLLENFSDLPDGDRVKRDSQTWSTGLFQEKYHPWIEGIRVDRRIRHADGDVDDLLIHRWKPVPGLQLELVESSTLLMVRPGPETPEQDLETGEYTAATIDTLADRILRRSGEYDGAFGDLHRYQWDFHYFPPMREGSRFSTAPGTDPEMLAHWTDRLDGGIESGKPFFVAYKKHVSGDGRLIFLSGKGWFDGSDWNPYR